MEKACGAIDIERSTTTSEANIFLAVLMIIPFRGRKRRLIVVTNIVSSNRTWTTTLSLEKSSRNMLILNRLQAFRCLVWVSGSGGGGAGRVVWGYGYHVVVHRRPATA